MPNPLSRMRGTIRRLFARPPKVPQRKPLGPGHRGVAAGNLQERTRRAEAGETAYEPEEVSKWRTISGDEVEDFVYNGQLFVVNSSNVGAFQYFPEDQKMMVEYLDGSAYLYSNVSQAEAIQVAEAPSKGAIVWDLFRVRGSKTAHKKPYSKIR